jgi:hypothetical protein
MFEPVHLSRYGVMEESEVMICPSKQGCGTATLYEADAPSDAGTSTPAYPSCRHLLLLFFCMLKL